ncbi:MAG: xanthan lyase [Bacteroidota bacterium]
MPKTIFVLPLLLMLYSCSSTPADSPLPKSNSIDDLMSAFENNELSFYVPPATKIDSIDINDSAQSLIINTNKRFSYRPFRENDVNEIYHNIRTYLGPKYYNYDIKINSMGYSLDELIPNYYRTSVEKLDFSRIPDSKIIRPRSLVTNVSSGVIPSNGLFGYNIALWHSHGWYYNLDQDRWLWQRARLFETVEDLGPLAYTVPYIIPMLENAGANVFVPRERDIQTNEVVVDNDTSTSGDYMEFGSWFDGKTSGFSYGKPPYANNFNPFNHGTYKYAITSNSNLVSIDYVPEIPQSGEYAVYISYHHSEDNIEDAHYYVHHTGGITEFIVNQKIGGETWIYLGTFQFNEGKNPSSGKVKLTNESDQVGKIVTADAVRFGGGMGLVERNGTVSGRPKYVEAARYYLQYAGMPDTLVYNLNEDLDDYKDDYQCRGEWVNYLVGDPSGPNLDRTSAGLGIPIDLSFAFHTDAGITDNDTVIGTLGIYSTKDFNSESIFPNRKSRFANRDLTDIMQTQIVEDIQAKYDPSWQRRYLMDSQYSEAARPNVPSTLLELMSHQNFVDVKFMNDPQFRFDVSRSIYKSMLRFLSTQYGFEYIVQPLPVTHLSTSLSQNGSVTITWQSQTDPLEETAIPNKYKLYTKTNDNGFDNGIIVDSSSITLAEIDTGVIYSYKVTALNEGGESFPSEILSVCWMNNDQPTALIINGFDRISLPAIIESDTYTGFDGVIDEGVPYKYDLGYVGKQFNFELDSRWATDDRPGHGASYANMETQVIAGNTFDYSYIHGEALKENGYSFVSVSDESVFDSIVNLKKYSFVDLILGEEKETHWQRSFADSLWGTRFKTFPNNFKDKIKSYLESGGNLFVSGAYIGSDLFHDNDEDDIIFAEEILHYKLDSDHAVKTGGVVSVRNNPHFKDVDLSFNTAFDRDIYKVEAPDAIGPNNGSETILRYTENYFSAGIGYKKEYGVIAMGFPFESIQSDSAKTNLMNQITNYLQVNRK